MSNRDCKGPATGGSCGPIPCTCMTSVNSQSGVASVQDVETAARENSFEQPVRVWDVPRLVQVVVLCMGVLLGLSSVIVCGLTIMASQAYWILLGMEMCVALAAAFAILFGRGLFREGPGMALACCAGTVLVAGVLGWISVHRGDFNAGGMTMKSGKTVSLNALLYGRVAISMVLGVIGAWLVLSRNSQSWKYLLRAVMAGVPMVACLGVVYAMRSWLRGSGSGGSGGSTAWVLWLVATVLAVVILGLLCATAHFVIRAFESGRSCRVTK